MIRKIQLAMVMAVGFGCLASAAQAAFVAFPTQARYYRTWLVRAMDQCSVATVSVTNAGDPSGGCVQANSTTDGDAGLGATMRFGRILVSHTRTGTGRVGIFGAGFKNGQRVKVRLTLRTTKKNQSTKHPLATNNVTFTDVTVDCGGMSVGMCFTANSRGVVVGSEKLTDCLAPNTGLARGNIQIVNASVVNCDTGKVVAVPGIIN